ncbi:MAG: acyl carrier protein [Alphaproteobacteria bacterium]
MTNATVADKVKKVVMDKFKIDESKVTENASFTDDIGADSLDQAELIMLFEEEFGCEIPQQDAEKIKTVKDAVDYLGKKSH